MSGYYTHSGYPAQSAPGNSVDARTEFDAIAAGFSLIAPYTGYGGRIVRINAGGTGQESVTLATATVESYADAQANTHRNLTTVAGTNTITAQATPTLTAYVTNQTFRFPAAGANTGATTIAIDGLAALPIHRPDGSALLASDISGAGYICDITIRAADAILNNPYNAANAVTSTSATSATNATNVVGSGTISNTATGGAALVPNASLSASLPQNSQSANYVTVLGNANEHILHPVADNNPRTFTIAANASVAYPIGTSIVFVNEINTLTIAINTDTLTWLGSGATGSRTLAANGIATALKTGTTSWKISGINLT